MKLNLGDRPWYNFRNPIRLPEMLIIIFIAMKCADIINWSWWWVFSPWWLPILAAMGFGLFMVIYLILFGDKD